MFRDVLPAMSRAALDILRGPVSMSVIVGNGSFDVRGPKTSLYIGTEGPHSERAALGLPASGRMERLFVPANYVNFGVVITPNPSFTSWEIRASGATDVFYQQVRARAFPVKRFHPDAPGFGFNSRGGDDVDGTIIQAREYPHLQVGVALLIAAKTCFAQVILHPPQHSKRRALRGDVYVGPRPTNSLSSATRDPLVEAKIKAASQPGSFDEVVRHNCELAGAFFSDYISAAREGLNAFSASGDLQFSFHPTTGRIISFCEKSPYGEYYALPESLTSYPRAIWKPDEMVINVNGHAVTGDIQRNIKSLPEQYNLFLNSQP